VRARTDSARRENILDGWFRRELKALLPDLIAKWEPVIGVQVAE
jgi:hypothetical protein